MPGMAPRTLSPDTDADHADPFPGQLLDFLDVDDTDDADWRLALFFAALDETHDPAEALAVAEEAIGEEGPPEWGGKARDTAEDVLSLLKGHGPAERYERLGQVVQYLRTTGRGDLAEDVLRYGWQDTGAAPPGHAKNKSGKARVWKGTPPDRGTRVQIIPPGSRKKGGSGSAPPGHPGPPKPKKSPKAKGPTPAQQKKAAAHAFLAHVDSKFAASQPLTAQELSDLATHLNNLTIAELHAWAQKPGVGVFSIGNHKLKAAKITRLMNWATSRSQGFGPKPPSPSPSSPASTPPAPSPGPSPAPPAPGPSPGPSPPSPGFTGIDSLGRRWINGKLVPKAVTNDDRQALEDVVDDQLKKMGLTAQQALQSRKHHAIYAALGGWFDHSVSAFQIERTLKNLWAHGTTVPIPAQFDYHGVGRRSNLHLPNESRPSLSQAETVAAQKYTSSAYIPLNTALRTTSAPPAKFSGLHSDLQSAMRKAKVFSKPVPVERGINLDPAGLAQFLSAARAAQATGQPITYPGYNSTAVAATGGVPPLFQANVVMHINAVHGLDMKPYHHHPHIDELLLDHNSSYHVTNITQDASGRYHVHYDQVPPAYAAGVNPPTGAAAGKPGFWSSLFGWGGKATAPTPPTPPPPGPKKFSTVDDSQTVLDHLSGKKKHPLITGTFGGNNDTFLQSVMNESGRGDPPKVMDRAGIDGLKAQGWKIVYRGVSRPSFTTQFRTGGNYAGTGIFGNGIYAAHGHGDESGARSTAKGYGPSVSRIAIPPTARGIKSTDLATEIKAYQGRLAADLRSGKIDRKKHDALIAITKDPGRYAALHNYDFIDVGGDYQVILNRGILAVEDKDY